MLVHTGTLGEYIDILRTALEDHPNMQQEDPEFYKMATEDLKRLDVAGVDRSKSFSKIYIVEISDKDRTVNMRWEEESDTNTRDGARTQWEFNRYVGFTHRIVIGSFEIGNEGLSWLMECFAATLVKCFSNVIFESSNIGRAITCLADNQSSCNKVNTGPPYFLADGGGGTKRVISFLKSNYPSLKDAPIMQQIKGFVPPCVLHFCEDKFEAIKRFNPEVWVSMQMCSELRLESTRSTTRMRDFDKERVFR